MQTIDLNHVNCKISIPRPVTLKDYSTAKIYKITFPCGVYIGSTIQTLKGRKQRHTVARKSGYTWILYKYFPDSQIELLEDYPLDEGNTPNTFKYINKMNKKLLQIREQHWMDIYNKLSPILNKHRAKCKSRKKSRRKN
jgi:hypothetical protein